MNTNDSGERWYAAPIGHMIAGPCPRCLRGGKTINCCRHQLPEALGYLIATFEIIDGHVLAEVVAGQGPQVTDLLVADALHEPSRAISTLGGTVEIAPSTDGWSVRFEQLQQTRGGGCR